MRNFELQCLFDLVEDGVFQFTRNATLDTILKVVSEIENEGLSESNMFKYIKLRVVSGTYTWLSGGTIQILVPSSELLSNVPNMFGLQVDKKNGYIELPACLITNPLIDTDTLLSALVEFLKVRLYDYYINNNFRSPDMNYSVLNIDISDIAKEIDISDIQQVSLKVDTLPCEFRSILSDQTLDGSGSVIVNLNDILRYIKASDDKFDDLIYKLRSIFCSKTWSVRNCQYESLLELVKEATAYKHDSGIRLLLKLPKSMLQPLSELFKIISEDIIVSRNYYSMIEVCIPDTVLGKESN